MEYSENFTKIICHTDKGGRQLALSDKKGKVLEFIVLPDNDCLPGAIFAARVAGKIRKDAYFVYIEDDTVGFLPVPKSEDVNFTDGQKIMVKIVKSAYGIKEAKLTTEISEEERRELANLFDKADKPSLIKPARDILISLLDKYGTDITEVVYDDLADRRSLENIAAANPSLKAETKYINGNAFEFYGLDEELAEAVNPCVVTNDGIRLFMEKTQAFWSVDVDSFRCSAPVAQVNMLAAKEILRQIRLRNISGQIVIDFICDSKHRISPNVVNFIKDELKKGDGRAFFAGISPLGHIEIVRKRTYPAISEIYKEGQNVKD